LHTLVLERRATKDRNELAVDGTATDQRFQLRLVGLLAFQVSFHGFFVEFNRGFDQLFAIFCGAFGEVCGNFLLVELRSQRLLFPNHRLHLHQIDKTGIFVLSTNRKLKNQRIGTEALDNHFNGAVEVRADLVHLVDEHHPRNLVLVALAPDGFGLRLDAGIGIKQRNSPVKHAQRTLDFNREVNVSGRVNDVQALVVPETGRCSGRDRDATLLLLLHPVHRGRAIVNFTDLVALTGIVEHTFGGRGLAGINMSHDAEIAIIFNRM